jgi:DNA-directed RNA polymerase specialized sigma24 family protein
MTDKLEFDFNSYRRFARAGISLAERRHGWTFSFEDREDLVQETIARFYEKTYSNGFPIRTIAYHLSVDRLRIGKKDAAIRDLSDIPFYPDDDVNHGNIVEYVLASSSAAANKVLVAILEGVPPTSRDLATELHLSEGTIRQYLSHIRKAVSRALHQDVLRYLISQTNTHFGLPDDGCRDPFQLPTTPALRKLVYRVALRVALFLVLCGTETPHSIMHDERSRRYLATFAIKSLADQACPSTLSKTEDPLEAANALVSVLMLHLNGIHPSGDEQMIKFFLTFELYVQYGVLSLSQDVSASCEYFRSQFGNPQVIGILHIIESGATSAAIDTRLLDEWS